MSPDGIVSHAARYLNGGAVSVSDFVSRLDKDARERLIEGLLYARAKDAVKYTKDNLVSEVPAAVVPAVSPLVRTMLDSLVAAAGVVGLRAMVDRLNTPWVPPEPPEILNMKAKASRRRSHGRNTKKRK